PGSCELSIVLVALGDLDQRANRRVELPTLLELLAGTSPIIGFQQALAGFEKRLGRNWIARHGLAARDAVCEKSPKGRQRESKRTKQAHAIASLSAKVGGVRSRRR